MCTVSWIHLPGGYQLLSNRDERDTRKPALPPVIHSVSGVRFIAPIDGDHGGSWIAVNQFGLAFSLVNRYRCGHCSTQSTSKPPSRGLLLASLAACRSFEEAQACFNRCDLTAYLPFTILVLAVGASALLLHWTGRDSLVECNGDSAMPLISSSFDARGVEVYRKRLFKTLASERGHIDLKLLMDFHASHTPIPCAYSPCMHRDNVLTVSFSRVTVAEGWVEFFYSPVAPCKQSECSSTKDTHRLPEVVRMQIVGQARSARSRSTQAQPLPPAPEILREAARRFQIDSQHFTPIGKQPLTLS